MTYTRTRALPRAASVTCFPVIDGANLAQILPLSIGFPPTEDALNR